MNQEPLWWRRARKLRAKGLTLGQIGRLCGKDHTSVLYAVSAEERRETRRARALAWAAGRPVKKRTPEQKTRHLVVSRAHAEARETGLHIDAVLIGWKTYPRRGRVTDEARV